MLCFLTFQQIRAEKTMPATDVTGFDVIFSTGFFASFSRFRGLVLLNCTYKLEKKQKIQWRARPSNGDGAPKLQISVPCRGRTCPEQMQPAQHFSRDLLIVRKKVRVLEARGRITLNEASSSSPEALPPETKGMQPRPP